jgi:hypothetical protein
MASVVMRKARRAARTTERAAGAATHVVELAELEDDQRQPRERQKVEPGARVEEREPADPDYDFEAPGQCALVGRGGGAQRVVD